MPALWRFDVPPPPKGRGPSFEFVSSASDGWGDNSMDSYPVQPGWESFIWIGPEIIERRVSAVLDGPCRIFLLRYRGTGRKRPEASILVEPVRATAADMHLPCVNLEEWAHLGATTE